MHYPLVNNEKNHVHNHMNMGPLDSRKLRTFYEFKLDLFDSIKFNPFQEINKIFQVFLNEIRFIFSFLCLGFASLNIDSLGSTKHTVYLCSAGAV